MRDSDFEDVFLDGLADMGQLGRQTPPPLRQPPPKYRCEKAGGTWHKVRRVCTIGPNIPVQPPLFSGMDGMALAEMAELGKQASVNPVQQLRKQERQAAQASRQEKRVAAADTKKQCENRGGFWDAGRQACTPKTAAPAAVAPATTPVTMTVKDRKTECLKMGGTWNANKKSCTSPQVVEGKLIPATPTNKAMCTAQGGTWYTAYKTCVRESDKAACAATGGSIDGRGKCVQPVVAPTTPEPGVPAVTGKVTKKADCESQGGVWYRGVRKCVLPAVSQTCVDQGGRIVRGKCVIPKGAGVVPPVEPVTVPPTVLATTPDARINRWLKCLGKQASGAKIGCAAPTGKKYQTPGYAEYFACLQRSVAGRTGEACKFPTGLVEVPSPTPGGTGTPETTPGTTPEMPAWMTQAPAWMTQPPSWYAQPPTPLPTDTGGAGAGSVYPGLPSVTGGGGPALLSEEGVTDSGMVPEGFAPDVTAVGAGVQSECDPAFQAMLPQEYSDEYGKMTVLMVVCGSAAQAAAQQVSPFTSYADTYRPSVESGSFGPMGSRPISTIESEEMIGGGGSGF